MYKVILTDDEQDKRRGIRSSVDWEALGMEVAAEAADGQAALRLIDELRPEILITDIKMPKLDGLQLSEMAMRLYPSMKIVLVSGYDDFAYAQKGISLGVSGYVLKPVNTAELESILKKLRTELDRGTRRVESAPHTDTEIQPLKLEKFFRGIIYKKKTVAEVADTQKMLMGEGRYLFAAALLQLDNYLGLISDMSDDEQTAFSRTFFETTDEYFAGVNNAIGIATEDYTYVVFIYDEDRTRIDQTINRICLQLKQIMLNNDMSISIGVGNTYESAYELKTSFKEARLALNLKFVSGANSTTYYSSVERMDSSFDTARLKTTGSIMSAIRTGNKDSLKKNLDETALEIMAGGSMSKAYLSLFMSSVFRQTLELLDSLGSSIEEIFEKPMEEYAELMSAQTMKNAMDMLYDKLVRVIDYMNLKKQGRFSFYIDKAKLYIEEHFTESDISLERIAGQIQMSVSYFSLEFKKTVGKTYIEFLTELRIRRAKELLLGTALKISEISEMVGYENSTYFNYLFKQNTGYTPGQFRRGETG